MRTLLLAVLLAGIAWSSWETGHNQGVRDGACMTMRVVAKQAKWTSQSRPEMCTEAEWNYNGKSKGDSK